MMAGPKTLGRQGSLPRIDAARWTEQEAARTSNRDHAVTSGAPVARPAASPAPSGQPEPALHVVISRKKCMGPRVQSIIPNVRATRV
jgi:hypothetical protein